MAMTICRVGFCVIFWATLIASGESRLLRASRAEETLRALCRMPSLWGAWLVHSFFSGPAFFAENMSLYILISEMYAL